MYILHMSKDFLSTSFHWQKSNIGSANIMQYKKEIYILFRQKFSCLFPISNWAAPAEINKNATDAKFSPIWRNRKSFCTAQFRLVISKGFYALVWIHSNYRVYLKFSDTWNELFVVNWVISKFFWGNTKWKEVSSQHYLKILMKLSKHGVSYSLKRDPSPISKITFFANLSVSPIFKKKCCL